MLTKKQYEYRARSSAEKERLYRQALRVKPQSREAALRLLSFKAEPSHKEPTLTPEKRRAERRAAWIKREGERLARGARMITDEHGFYSRGDHTRVTVLDYVPAYQSKAAPLLDSGGEGLAVVTVYRKRVYARSCRWSPSEREDRFLVGRNEAGTYFAHGLPKECKTVLEAVTWIWDGKEPLERQGDIAIVRAKGPRVGVLPRGHMLQGKTILHRSHAPLAVPGIGSGLRVIVGRRRVAPAVVRD